MFRLFFFFSASIPYDFHSLSSFHCFPFYSIRIFGEKHTRHLSFFLWKCAEFQSIFHFSPAKEHRTNSKRSAHNLFKYIRVFFAGCVWIHFDFSFTAAVCFYVLFLIDGCVVVTFHRNANDQQFHTLFLYYLQSHTMYTIQSMKICSKTTKKKEINSFVGLNEQCTNTRTLSTWILRDHRVVYE